MPIVPSSYSPPKRIFRNGDVSTLYSALIRKVNGVAQLRERLELPDGDFMDLEWSYASNKSDSCIIVLHGLEGNAQRPYVLGTAKIFNESGIDCCAVNYRSCSGEPNRLFSSYHSGRTEDIKAVLEYILEKGIYRHIYIKGFSLGGNLALKFAGESENLPEELRGIIAVSTPVDLEGCMRSLQAPRNFLYSTDFLLTLKNKLKEKEIMFPGKLTKHDINKIRTLKEYDDFYTSKANGFKNALDYYTRSSALQFLPNIKIPALLINAKNDSFLSDSCYPKEIAEKSKNVFLEMTDHGGHVGFVDKNNIYYNETRALKFIEHILSIRHSAKIKI
ncbi:putative alpha/beta-fold hydrolase [Chryseobacterium defluvii]|uniref:Putative alpha/beta-fold hydrolase n=1 Tax=Chryseobacterium defluvii TaxID=160396 RepID=A0A840KCY9_9FLAO|nr:alpha/beta fold hydrolase [Chryseobacterium defluvii]MBB4805410.1 putative alpha/beta-fold hydrolase [Chryseobacterium defluvii]